MKHFQFIRFTEDGKIEPMRTLVGVRCVLNGRCICQIVRLVHSPVRTSDCISLQLLADEIEDEVRDTVDRMDPEVLLDCD